MPTTESQNYNRIYELLVSGENDLVGQIAYAVYKQQKIDKIKRFIENNGRIPEKSDLASFTENAASEKQLGFYKEHALSILREFLEYTLDDQVNEIEAQKKADYDKRINDILIFSCLPSLRSFRLDLRAGAFFVCAQQLSNRLHHQRVHALVFPLYLVCTNKMFYTLMNATSAAGCQTSLRERPNA